MLVIFGWRSRIAEELRRELGWHPDDYLVVASKDGAIRATFDDYPLDAERYFFCSGYLAGKKLQDMTSQEITDTVDINFTKVVGACERILEVNVGARICVMGTESVYAGSYDDLYAMSKQRLHEYVERKRLKPDQQLVCVSPGIISDAGMTLRRADKDRLNAREEAHPKKRFANSNEVARLVRFLLYEDAGYITNTVIRMNGGEHTK